MVKGRDSKIKPIGTIAVSLVMALVASTAFAQGKPNIVLVFMDNFGWGEPGFNGGGIIRGAPTLRLAPPTCEKRS